MAARFRKPAQTGRSVLCIDNFLGVDFTNHPTNVDLRRSPGAVNMIRDVPGKVRKMMGYEQMAAYSGRINGVHRLAGKEEALVHAGTRLYRGQTLLYDGVADERSSAWQLGDCLVFLDGKRMLRYDGAAVVPVDTVAYVPTVSIANSPAGQDGVMYEELNLMQPKYTESFLGTASAVQYQLGFAPLDGAEVKAEVLDAQGSWQPLAEGVHFWVDRSAGVVHFTTAPGEGPLTGEDNVRITAQRTVQGYAERINRCRVCTAYGIGGAPDRLFVSGNPQFGNRDWFSGQNDPTYFGDLGYSVLGSEASAVMGYSIAGGLLATHKDGAEPQRSAILREGRLVDAKPAFPLCGTLPGVGALGRYSFGCLASEPVFFTGLGVFAVTTQDVTGEQCVQNRSFYLDGRLLAEPNLQDAFACVYRDFYFLCLNNKAYILDGLQPMPPERGMPYSTRQYAGFYRENLPARVMWEQDGRLWFGSEGGRLYRFYDDPEELQSYNDDGQPICARWETPDLDGRLFYNKKSFRYLAVRLAAAVATSVRVYALRYGRWSLLWEDWKRPRYLDFGRVIFSKFTFSGDPSPKLLGSRIRVARADKARFAFENREKNEPFGLFDIALEYHEGGKGG